MVQAPPVVIPDNERVSFAAVKSKLPVIAKRSDDVPAPSSMASVEPVAMITLPVTFNCPMLAPGEIVPLLVTKPVMVPPEPPSVAPAATVVALVIDPFISIGAGAYGRAPVYVLVFVSVTVPSPSLVKPPAVPVPLKLKITPLTFTKPPVAIIVSVRPVGEPSDRNTLPFKLVVPELLIVKVRLPPELVMLPVRVKPSAPPSVLLPAIVVVLGSVSNAPLAFESVPPLSVSALPDGKMPTTPSAKVPAGTTFVVPVYVFALLSVTVPVPAFVKPPAVPAPLKFEITPLTFTVPPNAVIVSVRPVAEASDRYILPSKLVAPELLIVNARLPPELVTSPVRLKSFDPASVLSAVTVVVFGTVIMAPLMLDSVPPLNVNPPVVGSAATLPSCNVPAFTFVPPE